MFFPYFYLDLVSWYSKSYSKFVSTWTEDSGSQNVGRCEQGGKEGGQKLFKMWGHSLQMAQMTLKNDYDFSFTFKTLFVLHIIKSFVDFLII